MYILWIEVTSMSLLLFNNHFINRNRGRFILQLSSFYFQLLLQGEDQRNFE